MLKFSTEGVIFILLRKLAIPVAFIVVWIGVGSVAVVGFKKNDIKREEYMVVLAQKAEAAEKEIKEKEEAEKLAEEQSKLLEQQNNLNRGNITSRSGSRTERENVNPIYYEELGVTVYDHEIEMLERIVQAEAGGSGYDGMLAVANVVLNRVKYSRFPNTVEEVIFANRQFTPISDGRYYKVKVSETARQVVKDALNGARIVDEDALYFCTPTAPGKGWFETDLRKITYVAPHNFYGYK